MLRRIGLVALAALVLGAASAHAERIVSYEVEIYAQAGGALLVTETIRYDFEGAWRHGIYRDVPLVMRRGPLGARRLSLRLLEVRMDGGPVPVKASRVGDGNGEPYVRWRIGDPGRRITGVHRYEISYRAEGALVALDEARDAFVWNAIGTGWEVPVDEARVVFVPPEALMDDPALVVRAFVGPRGATQELAPVPGEAFVWEAAGLRPHEGITVEAAFPRGAIAATAPRGVLTELLAYRKAEIGIWALCLLCVLGFAVWWYRQGRDPRIGPVAVRYAPPAGLDAAEAGMLIHERAGPETLAAALIELARDGYVRVVRTKRRGLFGSGELRLVRERDAAGWKSLPAYKQALLHALFPADTRVFSSEMLRDPLRSERLEWLDRFRRELGAQVRRRGLMADDPVRARRVPMLVAMLLLAGLGAFVSLVRVPLSPWFMLVWVLSGMAMLGFASQMPRRTRKGARLLREVLGFRRFVERAERPRLQRLMAENPDYFTRTLPFAAVFGLADAWAERFAGLVTPPEWYAGGDFGHFGRDLGSLGNDVTGAIASSSGGTSGGGVGGGGGGGGGGSW